MSSIVVSYTPISGSPVYALEFKEFSSSALPRSYTDTQSFSISTTGATVLSGLPIRRRFQWTISVPLSKSQAADLDSLFRAWEHDRADGAIAAVLVQDSTFGQEVSTAAIFTSPPIFDQFGPVNMLVSFGLTEL